ncbi:MAG: hypothetical protein ABI597_07700 [Gammaproteobacteria bacterium]
MKWRISCALLIIFSIASTAMHANTVVNKCLAHMNTHLISPDTAWLDECNLTDRNIKTLSNYLDKHPEITQLYLINNHIGDRGAILLSKHKTLKLLELRNNHIGVKGATALARSSIHMLDLEGNKLDFIALAKRNVPSSNKVHRSDNETIILG